MRSVIDCYTTATVSCSKSLEIADRHDIVFLKIGTDRNHVHVLVQTISPYSPTKLLRVIKSLTLPGRSSAGCPRSSSISGAGSSGRMGAPSARSAATGAKGRSNATSSNRAGRRSTPSSIRNSSDFSEGIRPMRSDTSRLAAGQFIGCTISSANVDTVRERHLRHWSNRYDAFSATSI